MQKPTTIVSPTLARERLVEYYQRQTRAAYGREVDRALLERKVITQLELVEGAKRSGDLRESTTRRVELPPVPDQRFDLAGNATPAERLAYRPRVLHQNPMEISERWALCTGRMVRILEGAGASSTFEGATANAEIPKLARRYMDAFANYMTRTAPPPPNGRRDPNPFRGMSDRDASRAFMRECEDIADASTGRMGPWRTPK